MPKRLLSVTSIITAVLLAIAGLSLLVWLTNPAIGSVQSAQIQWSNRPVLLLSSVTGTAGTALFLVVIALIAAVSLREPTPWQAGALPVLLAGGMLIVTAIVALVIRLEVVAPAFLQEETQWLPAYRVLGALASLAAAVGMVLIGVAGAFFSVPLWKASRLPMPLFILSVFLLLLAVLLPAYRPLLVCLAILALAGAAATLGHIRVAVEQVAMPASSVPSSREARRAQRPKRRRR